MLLSLHGSDFLGMAETIQELSVMLSLSPRLCSKLSVGVCLSQSSPWASNVPVPLLGVRASGWQGPRRLKSAAPPRAPLVGMSPKLSPCPCPLGRQQPRQPPRRLPAPPTRFLTIWHTLGNLAHAASAGPFCYLSFNADIRGRTAKAGKPSSMSALLYN